jgi:hypothetical protein
MRRSLFAVIALLCSLMVGMGASISPVAASDVIDLWLYDQNSKGVVRLDGAGNITDSFFLPMDSSYTASATIAVSDSGNLFGYTQQDPGSGQKFMMVYDRALNSVTQSYNLPADSITNLEMVSEARHMFLGEDVYTFSYITGDYSYWEVVSIDLGSALLTTLDSTSAVVSGTDLAGGFLFPVARAVNTGEVHLTAVLMAAGGSDNYNSYIWREVPNTLTQTKAFPALDTDYLVFTGETVSAQQDTRLPVDASGAFPMFQGNTLQAYTPDDGGIAPFFHQADYSMYRPHFIQGGERVLFSAGDTSGSSQSMLVNRDGSAWTFLATPYFNDAAGTQFGFVYLTNTIEGGISVNYLDTSGFISMDNSVSLREFGAEYPNIQIVWTPTLYSGGAPFTPWAVLAEKQFLLTFIPGLTLVTLPPPTLDIIILQVLPTATPVFLQVLPSLTPQAVIPGGGGGVAQTQQAVAAQQTIQAGVSGTLAAQAAQQTAAAGGGGVPAGQLAVGMNARVQNGPLNVRSSPSTSAAVAEILQNGAVVQIIGGPQIVNGLKWWQVRTALNTVGWAVEFVGTDITLVPN